MAYQDRRCFVLKSVNYKDADKIFTLYSDKDGRISASARGVRKISSKRAGSLDRLNLVKLSYYQGASGYKTITEVTGVFSFRHLKSNPDKVKISYQIIEVLLKTLEEDAPDRRLFNLLERTFLLLDTDAVYAQAVLGYFLLNFMEILGYKLSLAGCVLCGHRLSKEWGSAAFNYDKGGLVCSNCKTFEPALELKSAALMAKLKDLAEVDFRFFQKETVYLHSLMDVLHQYVRFKLEG
ncbi:DNA repair protein RecO [candidate division WWE3 bacterium]|nr:DNA repair protein RecO [candidate division WWE3 bacterium]